MKLDPNDPKVTAYALGELSGEERASIEAGLAGSAEARQEVERVREVAALLTQELKKEPLGALSQLHRIAIESETHRMRQPRRRGVPWMGLTVAASLLLATGLYFLRPKSPDVDLVQGGGAGSTPPDQTKQTAPVN